MSLAVGQQFKFETVSGRKGHAHVLCTRNPINPSYPLHCMWRDERGKHYEWFHPSEFISIEVVK